MPSTFRRALFLAAALAAAAPLAVFADAQNDLQGQINDRNQKINQLQQEIAQLQGELDQVSQEKQTLQSAVQSLDLSRRKLTTQISLTQTQISRTDLEIKTLSGSIATTSDRIALDSAAVEEALRNVNILDRTPPAMIAVTSETLSSFFDEINSLATVRDDLRQRIDELSSLKDALQTSKAAAVEKRAELASLQKTLAGQKQALDATIASKSQLLAETKNKESNYQDLIAQKKEQERQFEQDLQDLQNQLKGVVDVATLPHPGSGVLSWPFPTDFMAHCTDRAKALGNAYCVTQYFGNTPFATQNPQVYNGHGHNGIDIGAPIGTPILSVRGGIVEGTGNTDVGSCYSYGKWVLVKHDNGLSTLYAHLSSIFVSKGQSVATGDTLGYSGMTGYATGPHLHFTVFASDVVEIMNLGSWYAQNGQKPTSPCAKAGVSVPVAPLGGYLNPLSYL